MKVKLYLLFFFFILFISTLNMNDISQNGIKRNSLLDEFYQDSPVVKNFRAYSKHFTKGSNLSLLIFPDDKDKEITREQFNDLDQTISRYFSESTISPLFLPGELIELGHHIGRERKNAFIIPLVFSSSDTERKNSAIEKLEHTKEKGLNHENVNFDFIGIDYFRYHIFKEIKQSFLTLLPLSILLISVILFIAFRSTHLVVTTLFTLGFSFFATGTLTYFLQKSISMFSSFSLLFVFIIGTSDLIHLYAKASRLTKEEELSFLDSFKKAISLIFRPCLMTSLTTFISLVALSFSPFKTLHQFGLNGAIGVAISFLSTFFLLPFVLQYFQIKLSPLSKETYPLSTFLGVRFPKISLWVGFSLLLIFIFKSSSVEFNDNFYRKFKSSHPLSVSMSHLKSHLGYVDTIQLFAEESTFRSREYQNLEKALLNFPEVKNVISINSIYRSIMETQPNEDLARDVLDHFPYTKYSDLLISSIDSRKARSIVFLKELSQEESHSFLLKTRKSVEQANLKEKVELNGMYLIRLAFIQLLEKNYTRSFLYTFAMIFLLFILYFKSLKWASIAMIPNLAAPISVISLMAFLDISADMNLPLICSLSLAISVDDTIHFLTRYLDKNGDNCLKSTISEVSFPLVFSTLILVISMSVFTVSDIKFFTTFFTVMSFSLLTALFYDLIVLPAFIYLQDREK